MTGKSQPGESEGLNRQTLVRNQLGRLKRERISALTSCLSCPLASAGCLEDRTEKVRSIGRLFLARVLGHPKRSTGFEASCHHPPPATPSLKRMCSTHSLLLGSDFQDAKRKKAKEWVSNNGTWCGGMGRGCRGEIESICDCGRN